MAQQRQTHVLMTIYNGEAYLARSIPSFLAQTQPDLTLIVYDDGSTDATAARVRAYAREAAEGKIVFLADNPHLGTATGRARLVEASQRLDPDAAFLWLDVDDCFTSQDSVREVSAQMAQTEADICLFNFNIDWENDSAELRHNAAGLMIDQQNHARLLDDIRRAPDQIVSLATCSSLWSATSLGGVKAYAPSMKKSWPHVRTDLIFADFVPMGLLLQAARVTAMPAATPVFDFLRRESSTTGARKPTHFLVDLPGQLACFLSSVDLADPAQAAAASSFVRAKLAQYGKTLDGLISGGREGFEPPLRARYQEIRDELEAKLPV